MSRPVFSNMLQPLLYPAALTAFGVVCNVYILSGEVKDVRDEWKGDIKSVKDDVKGLLRRQTELEVQHMARFPKTGHGLREKQK
ncbi:MAG: hypothetical protein Q9211_007151 [Gyalolechia sp. 1 TL-2023]